jgi:hypothetical protein
MRKVLAGAGAVIRWCSVRSTSARVASPAGRRHHRRRPPTGSRPGKLMPEHTLDPVESGPGPTAVPHLLTDAATAPSTCPLDKGEI